MRFTKFAAAALGLSAVASTYAWNDTGHMVIAAVAEGNLDRKAWDECDRLIKIEAPEQYKGFIAGSVWADYADTGKSEWHFNLAGVRFDGRKVTVVPTEENAVTAINKFSAILGDKSKPDAERAQALRYLLHLVADIHQPLHTATLQDDQHPDGDKGGAEFLIKASEIFPGMGNPPQNLHYLWDMGAGAFMPGAFSMPLGAEGEARVRMAAQILMGKFTKKMFADQSKNLDPAIWAKESYDIAGSTAFKVRMGGEIDLNYASIAKTLASSRAVLAGYRIAELLNKTVGEGK